MSSTRKMEISDFLEVMEDNISDFAEYAELSQENRAKLAQFRIDTGPAVAFLDSKGVLKGVGGISIYGIGEGWTISPRRIQSHPDRKQRPGQFIDLIRDTREVFGQMCDEHNLWQVFGKAKFSTSYLEHLGFEKANNTMIWTRK